MINNKNTAAQITILFLNLSSSLLFTTRIIASYDVIDNVNIHHPNHISGRVMHFSGEILTKVVTLALL